MEELQAREPDQIGPYPPAGYQGTPVRVPGRRRNRGWLRWGVSVAAVVAAAGTIGGLLATTPGGSASPVPRPTTSTVTPPLSDAVFHWGGDVEYVVTSVVPPDPVNTVFGAPGQAGTDYWTIFSDCGPADCRTSLSGTLFGHDFSMRLTRVQGGEYAGTLQETGYTKCLGVSVTGVLSITSTITHAALDGREWQVTAWSGDATLTVPPVTVCHGDTFEFALTDTA